MGTRGKNVGYFNDAEAASRSDDDVEQELESLRRQLLGNGLETIAPHHKEAAQGIGQRNATQVLREGGRKAADCITPLTKSSGVAAHNITAADDEIRAPRSQRLEHAYQ